MHLRSHRDRLDARNNRNHNSFLAINKFKYYFWLLKKHLRDNIFCSSLHFPLKYFRSLFIGTFKMFSRITTTHISKVVRFRHPSDLLPDICPYSHGPPPPYLWPPGWWNKIPFISRIPVIKTLSIPKYQRVDQRIFRFFLGEAAAKICATASGLF